MTALIDTHVHFHDCFDVATFLEAASANLDRVESELDLGGPDRPARVLLVMETGETPLIDHLERKREDLLTGGWEPRPTADAGSLTIHHPDRPAISVVVGRQVVTADRLELLATPCPADLPSGLPLVETVDAAQQLEAAAILPWGFGKWTGHRGRIVSELLESWSPGRLILADNGGRLDLSWKPRLLTLAAQRGFPVVLGSDPLPLASEARRVGSSGSLLRGDFDPIHPAASTRVLLHGLREPPRSFGRGVGPIAFVTNQIYMQLRRGNR